MAASGGLLLLLRSSAGWVAKCVGLVRRLLGSLLTLQLLHFYLFEQ